MICPNCEHPDEHNHEGCTACDCRLTSECIELGLIEIKAEEDEERTVWVVSLDGDAICVCREEATARREAEEYVKRNFRTKVRWDEEDVSGPRLFIGENFTPMQLREFVVL